MKMTAMFNGLKIHNSEYYEKENSDILELKDGTVIYFECYENDGPNDCYNYADWSALEDTGFFNDDINHENLKLEACDYGFRINGYFVPCYSSQNGYYTDEIDIIASYKGTLITKLTTECDEY